MIRSASASLRVRSTIASSLYRGMRTLSRVPGHATRPTRCARLLGGALSGQGQPDLERGADADRAGEIDRTAVRLDDRLRDRQPDPGPGDRVDLDPGRAEELHEHVLELLLRDATTGVRDLDDRLVAVTTDPCGHVTAGGSELD